MKRRRQSGLPFLREEGGGGGGGGACVQIVCAVAAAATVKGEVIKERQFWIEDRGGMNDVPCEPHPPKPLSRRSSVGHIEGRTGGVGCEGSFQVLGNLCLTKLFT